MMKKDWVQAGLKVIYLKSFIETHINNTSYNAKNTKYDKVQSEF